MAARYLFNLLIFASGLPIATVGNIGVDGSRQMFVVGRIPLDDFFSSGAQHTGARQQYETL